MKVIDPVSLLTGRFSGATDAPASISLIIRASPTVIGEFLE
jgi:hypothetical protein